jgi:bifunctional non-homologous end joining protein LigD
MATKDRTKARPAKKSSSGLGRYRSMRNFDATPEPMGELRESRQRGDATSLPFVIQKHAASRLHYDFRLSWKGVLKSWAVTKGPSYFPGDKRLAVQVEDHPSEYGGFEGTIPKGQYGGGTVLIWDRGTWSPLVDVDEGLKKGSLKFELHGEKLKGKWALIRMAGRAANEEKPNWLLIKERDAFARTEDARPVIDEAPDSVASGRDFEAISDAKDRVWSGTGEQANKSQKAPARKKSAGRPTRTTTPGKRTPNTKGVTARGTKESFPSFIAPQLASPGKSPPTGGRWLHEIKLDGYRIQARFDSSSRAGVELLTRTGLNWAKRMTSIGAAIAALPVESAVLDGEVVVLSSDGTSSFAKLQAAFQEGARHALTYFVFDVLHLNGRNLRELPLIERKSTLAELFHEVPTDGPLRLSEHMQGDARDIFQSSCRLGAEGIVSKLASGRYKSGRGGDWLKLKCHAEQELIVAGFTLPSNGIVGVGALLLGYYRDGSLVYAGRCGTGFTQKTHTMLRARLEELRQANSPFQNIPAGVARGVQWVKPVLVAQFSFANWTADQLVRQAAFKGLREDKPARDVRREAATITPRNKHRERDAGAAHRTPSMAAKRATLSKTEQIQDDGLPVRLTHPDKIVDSASGLTKEALAHYYLAVSDALLPHIVDRPLTLVRCMDGSGKPCFYQKHKNNMLPADFGTVEVVDKKSGKSEPYITLSTQRAIVELAQIGVLEVHPWGSRNGSLEMPDRVVFDLDPDEAVPWKTIAASALEIRDRLKAAGLESFLKTTGGKGLHVVVPIRAENPWPEVKRYAHDFVLAMERDTPSRFLTRMTKSARTGKIYLDYLRNERGATSIAPFSPRARAGIPVAMPLRWSELQALERPVFPVSEFSQWKARLARDPWRKMYDIRQRLVLLK